MAGLKDLKNRLNSINTNKQITKAMQLVSTAKMKNAVRDQSNVEDYFSTIVESTHRIAARLNGEKSHWLSTNNSNKKGYVILTSDMGLCGGYNQSIIKDFLSRLDGQNNEDLYLIVFGKKGVDKLVYNGFNIDIKYVNVMDASNSGLSQRVADVIKEGFINGEFKSIEVIYTHFINALESEVRSVDLLPIKLDDKKLTEFKSSQATLIEPNIHDVLESLVEQYIVGVLYSTFINAIASEQTARRNSMENATKNAEELSSDLLKVINRERQAKITQEISEIVSGSESLKK